MLLIHFKIHLKNISQADLAAHVCECETENSDISSASTSTSRQDTTF